MGLHIRNGHQNLFVLYNLSFYPIYVEISVFNDIAPFEVHMGTVGGLLHGWRLNK